VTPLPSSLPFLSLWLDVLLFASYSLTPLPPYPLTLFFRPLLSLLSAASRTPFPSTNLHFLLPRILGVIQRAHVPHRGCTHVPLPATTTTTTTTTTTDKNVLPSKPIVARTVYALLHHLTMHVSRSRVSTFPPKFVQQFCIYFRYYILHPFRASR